MFLERKKKSARGTPRENHRFRIIIGYNTETVLDAAHGCATEKRSACPPAELGSCTGGARTPWQKQQEWPVAPRAAGAAGASGKVEAGVEAEEAGEARAQET